MLNVNQRSRPSRWCRAVRLLALAVVGKELRGGGGGGGGRG
eukprot:COSAG02_NODE_1563_length_11913_cov_6.216438_1_plen_40_part_10